MDPLYKIIKQLSEEEFADIYQNLTSNKADKSARFLKTIRESENPVEDFLDQEDISASAFYVLKSRLNQKVENFLLNRLGDPSMEAIHKVFRVYDLIFDSPREIAITTLKRLEKTMIEMDNPLVLMVVYRSLKMLYNSDDEQRAAYEKDYNQAVAFYLASEKAIEAVMAAFRAYSRYYLGRKDRDLNEMVKVVEKVNNLNNLYQSQRLFICKSIVHLYAREFMELPEHVHEIMDDMEEAFDRSFQILEKGSEDILFKNINLIFDYLRFVYYQQNGPEEKARIYFEVLDFKIEELLTHFNFGMDCSHILFYKLERHRRDGTMQALFDDTRKYISQMETDPENLVTYLNYHMFLAHVAYYEGNYENASRILYRLRNKVNLRKYPHADAEVKMFLALTYVLQDEADLANQLILSLQRQFKKVHFNEYGDPRLFLKVLSYRLSSKTTKKVEQAKEAMDEFEALNQGRYALLPYLDFRLGLFPGGDA